jgi:hypothetical protein
MASQIEIGLEQRTEWDANARAVYFNLIFVDY